MDRWDHNLTGITQARPPDDMSCALLYEQVRAMKCLELDRHLWNRDETVRNYAFLRTSVATAIANWRLRENAERILQGELTHRRPRGGSLATVIKRLRRDTIAREGRVVVGLRLEFWGAASCARISCWGADCKFSHGRNCGGSPGRRGRSMSPVSKESGLIAPLRLQRIFRRGGPLP